MLTTFLATPCTAPLFGPAIAWATSQPPIVTITVFLAAGLGMASPYLLIGAFPELVRFLPKPGAWMETFKQFMGFVMMGTVVYLLAFLRPQYVVPTTGLLFGISLACWLVGRVGPEREFAVKLRTWALGTAIVGISWILMFPGLDEQVLGRYHFPGLVAVMTPDARGGLGQFLVVTYCRPQYGARRFYRLVVPELSPFREYGAAHHSSDRSLAQARCRCGLKADWSDGDPNVTAMLDVLGSKQVPVIAIFSARDPNRPTIFRGSYTQREILQRVAKGRRTARSRTGCSLMDYRPEQQLRPE